MTRGGVDAGSSDGQPERAHLRRIAWCFFAIVMTLPLVALGGVWTYVLLVDLAIAVVAFREAMRLRALRNSSRE